MEVDNSCAGTSMYLSFDAESTIASMAYKTLEASTISAIGMDDVQMASHNSTLEAQELPAAQQTTAISRIHTKEPSAVGSPLRPVNKILKEYKALCSTPSKEQLMRSVDVQRGSDPHHCLDFGVAFLADIEEEEKATTPLKASTGENKENAQPESEEGSTLGSSTEITTTVIERKQVTPSLVEKEGANESGPRSSKAMVAHVKGSTAPNKQRRSILTSQNNRRSVCEPDLKTNRPSRIAVQTKKRTSLAPAPLPNVRARDCAEGDGRTADIPSLLTRMLKISDAAADPKSTESNATGTTKATTSRLSHGEKRPFTSMSKRMSVLVKTTLNSPARKIARRSIIATSIQPPAGRKSLLPPRRAPEAPPSGSAPGAVAADGLARKSMLPVGRKAMPPPPPETKEATASKTTTNRKSLHPLAKPTVMAPPVAAAAKALKQPTNYICSFCSSKFTLKSLLDAHKRCHENDVTPTFARKPAAASNGAVVASSGGGGDKQCKFCDKKFALLRALHIHLLQNCAKIPPNEKRKLHFTELQHVEKAQLPALFQSVTHSSSGTSTPSVPPTRSLSSLSSGAASSSESTLLEKTRDITVLANELVAAVDGVLTKMPPPSSIHSGTSGKKKHAHAGVYRTPNKAVPCHICKKTFKTVLQYTDHAMAMHATSPLGLDGAAQDAANKASQ